jgi:hypothetical protein
MKKTPIQKRFESYVLTQSHVIEGILIKIKIK